MGSNQQMKSIIRTMAVQTPAVRKPVRYYQYCTGLLLCFYIISACSMNTLAIRATGSIIEYSMEAFFEESDVIFAETALQSHLKLLEGLIKGDPQNVNLLTTACQGFTSYALAFLEDTEPDRAGIHYLRAKEYGLRALECRKAGFADAAQGPLDVFESMVKQCSIKELPALFWTANAWASWINLHLDSPAALADFSRVQWMMERVLELDNTFYYAGPHLFFGTAYGIRPVMFGGDPAKAKMHFETNLSLTESKFLLTYVYYAKFYAAKLDDPELFTTLLTHVLETPADILPQQRLVNEVAKLKAQHLLEKRDEYFYE